MAKIGVRKTKKNCKTEDVFDLLQMQPALYLFLYRKTNMAEKKKKAKMEK
jgi:hypothetical protein